VLAAYVTRGVKAGVVAGLVFGLFVALLANPLVAFADELDHAGGSEGAAVHGDERTEHHDGAGHGDGAGDAHAGGSAVSAAVTNAVSVVSGVLWGVLLGGVVFGAAYYLFEPALPGAGATKSYALAAAGFVTVSGAPWLALPPVPGVGDAIPTDTRLALYGGMMVAGALACLLSGAAYGRVRRTRGRSSAVGAASVPLALLAVPAALSPTARSLGSASVPPELAAGLSGTVVFGQLLLWTVLAAANARFGRPDDGERDPGSTSVGGTTTAD
jgi:hypothetical protein